MKVSCLWSASLACLLFATPWITPLASPMEKNENLTLFTEEFPPFNFTEAGKTTGVSTEVVEAVLKQAGYDYEIRSYPWARTYKVAQETPNALVFSISRRANREDLFKWVGEVVPAVHSVFALRDRTDIQIEDLQDLRRYEIGTNINDAREAYLMNNGFEAHKLQRIGGNSPHLVNYRKLKLGRIDLWPMPDAVMSHIVRTAGDDPEETLRNVFVFNELSTGGYYIAASLRTPDIVVDKIRKTLEKFKKTGEYRAILREWGLYAYSDRP